MLRRRKQKELVLKNCLQSFTHLSCFRLSKCPKWHFDDDILKIYQWSQFLVTTDSNLSGLRDHKMKASCSYCYLLSWYILTLSTKFRSSHWICSVRWGLRPKTLLKKRLWHRCLPVNFLTPFLQDTSGWLLLEFESSWFEAAVRRRFSK